MAEGRRNQSYAALRAVLPTPRGRLTVDEAAQRAAQLPLLTRGIYCERRNPSRVPHKMGARDFVERVGHGCPFNITMGAEELVHGVVTASRKHLSGGQWDDVVAILPRELRSVLASQ